MKSFLTLIMVAIIGGAVAQPTNQVNTYNYLKKGQLEKAMNAIDEASEHEKTMNDPKTWFYRGQTYKRLGTTQKAEYKKLAEDPLGEAADSFEKCLELDAKGRYTEKVLRELGEMENLLLNAGASSYNNKEYEQALLQFQRTVIIADRLQFTDSMAIYYAGISAAELKRYETAVKYFKRSIEIGYRGAAAYSRLAKIYFAQDDLAMATQTLTEGMEKYPKDKTLMVDMTNYYLDKEDFKGAEKMLKSILERDPDNAVFHFYLGSIYDKGTQFDLAEREYGKATQLDSAYFDAFYNLGALHYNQGVEAFNLANNITDQARYKTMKDKAVGKFEKALPLLEKAHFLNEEDKATMISLMQIYARTNRTKKYDSINAKLNN